MPVLARIRGTLRALTRAEALDRELDDELSSYLELLTDEKIRRGMDPVLARREAMMELGGAEQVKAAVRHTRHGAALDSLLRDIRHAARTMRQPTRFPGASSSSASAGRVATRISLRFTKVPLEDLSSTWTPAAPAKTRA